MKAGFIISVFSFLLHNCLSAQDGCSSYLYQQELIAKEPGYEQKFRAIEAFIQQKTAAVREQAREAGRIESNVIRIPVVVHLLYHAPEEKISESKIAGQIDALNNYFRRRNADTIKAPEYFRRMGADVEIEFQLAISDPRRRATNGIVKKYTPIAQWNADDQMKFSSSMGDDAWDSKSYLNIWVCNLDKYAGYATPPGGDAAKDGIVISYKAFGLGTTAGYEDGKTAVHEVGHWLNLKHIWGDANCGDDGVADTPPQATYTRGCPSTVRVTCNNGPHGDMYMNYMDLTNDKCINLFTQGQKDRMRALFEPGGPRNMILVSKGLSSPLIAAAPIPEEDPRWLEARLYPNPASTQLTIDFSYDSRWIGKNIFVTNIQGQRVMNVSVTSKIQVIKITNLAPGIYFLAAKKDDGESMKTRFVKL